VTSDFPGRNVARDSEWDAALGSALGSERSAARPGRVGPGDPATSVSGRNYAASGSVWDDAWGSDWSASWGPAWDDAWGSDWSAFWSPSWSPWRSDPGTEKTEETRSSWRPWASGWSSWIEGTPKWDSLSREGIPPPSRECDSRWGGEIRPRGRPEEVWSRICPDQDRPPWNRAGENSRGLVPPGDPCDQEDRQDLPPSSWVSEDPHELSPRGQVCRWEEDGLVSLGEEEEARPGPDSSETEAREPTSDLTGRDLESLQKVSSAERKTGKVFLRANEKMDFGPLPKRTLAPDYGDALPLGAPD